MSTAKLSDLAQHGFEVRPGLIAGSEKVTIQTALEDPIVEGVI